MLCPENNNKDFDELDCRDCKWYFSCYNLCKEKNVFGKENNFTKLSRNTIYELGKRNKSSITKNEIENFKIDLNTLSSKEIFKRLGE